MDKTSFLTKNLSLLEVELQDFELKQKSFIQTIFPDPLDSKLGSPPIGFVLQNSEDKPRGYIATDSPRVPNSLFAYGSQIQQFPEVENSSAFSADDILKNTALTPNMLPIVESPRTNMGYVNALLENPYSDEKSNLADASTNNEDLFLTEEQLETIERRSQPFSAPPPSSINVIESRANILTAKAISPPKDLSRIILLLVTQEMSLNVILKSVEWTLLNIASCSDELRIVLSQNPSASCSALKVKNQQITIDNQTWEKVQRRLICF